jgi:hypothetical protein
MKSKRTISYIGLWALIMPWLGFSWGTKTFLFSLTGAVLLIIGNRQYHNEKKKEKHSSIKELENSSNFTPETKLDYTKTETVTEPVYQNNPEANNFNSKTNEIENIPATKPRARRKIEMTPRVKKIAIKSEPYSIEDSNYDIQ